jgi:uncharacterized protein Yka (UPF0111/DUF47 family)
MTQEVDLLEIQDTFEMFSAFSDMKNEMPSIIKHIVAERPEVRRAFCDTFRKMAENFRETAKLFEDAITQIENAP